MELGLYLDEIAKYITTEEITLSGNLPDASFVAVVNHPESTDENTTHFAVFPNPANDFVTLKGEDLGTVRVYNAIGQKVDEFKANGSELRINTTGYNNGIFFVKTDNQMMKFVVRH